MWEHVGSGAGVGPGLRARLLSSEVSTYTSSYKICSSNFSKMGAVRIKEQSIMTFRRYFYCLETLT